MPRRRPEAGEVGAPPASLWAGTAAEHLEGGVTQPTDEAGEFGFELQVCAWAEEHWPPDRGMDSAIVVGRQLGTRDRRWDTVVVEADPQGLRDRAGFGGEALDSDLLHVVRHAPEEWAWYRDSLPHPGYPWRYVREAVHRAADRGVVETRTGDAGRIELRRIAPYPNWVERIVAIENKPDLDASAAAALGDQLRRDVARKLADEVWLATRATGERVEPALLADIPVEAGVLVVGPTTTDVQWRPAALPVDQPGTKILANPAGGVHDQSAARFEYASRADQHKRRLVIAERAYGRGWRSYAETMRPDCRHFDLARGEHGWLPYCTAKQRHQRGAKCAGDCPEFEPEPPAWRQRGWPIEGGPGTAVKRLLRHRRERRRPEVDQ